MTGQTEQLPPEAAQATSQSPTPRRGCRQGIKKQVGPGLWHQHCRAARMRHATPVHPVTKLGDTPQPKRPLSTKSNPYLDKIKAEHDALNQELTPLKAELAEAEAEHAAAREKQNRLRDAAGSMSMNTPPEPNSTWAICGERRSISGSESGPQAEGSPTAGEPTVTPAAVDAEPPRALRSDPAKTLTIWRSAQRQGAQGGTRRSKWPTDQDCQAAGPTLKRALPTPDEARTSLEDSALIRWTQTTPAEAGIREGAWKP